MDLVVAAASTKPIVVQAFGQSSVAEGSSEEAQRLFYETFFAVVEQRRASFALVNAFELHDLAQAPCDAYVASQGEEPGGPFAAAYCFHGLATATGAQKPAWQELLEGSATFASP